MDDIRRAKKLLESKGYTVSKKLVFEGLDESDVTPLNEFVNLYGNDYAWGESLEDIHEATELQGNQLEEYEVGDLIMPATAYSPQSNSDIDPHKILLIKTKKDTESGIIQYRGFVLSTKMEKANKYNKRYPNNIYIKDYADILYKGPRDHKEAFIRVDDIVEFTNEDLNTRGSWKGSVSYKFFRFVNNCYDNYKHGIDNSNKYWTSERRYNNGRNSQETA